MKNAVKLRGDMLLGKVFCFLLFSTFFFASCNNKEKEPPSPKQIGFPAKDRGVFRSQVWQTSDSLLMYIQPPFGFYVPDNVSWHSKSIKVEIFQEGPNSILSLPYVLFENRHQAAPDLFYSIRNDHALYSPDWRTGPIIIFGKQNRAIDFTKKADVRITRFF